MNGCETLIELMRNEGARNNPPVIQLGEMLSDVECRIGENNLGLEDLYLAEHLTDHERAVDIENVGDVDATTTTESGHLHKLQSITTKETAIRIHTTLKKGDLVAAYRMSEDKYLIFAKVVSGDVSV